MIAPVPPQSPPQQQQPQYIYVQPAQMPPQPDQQKERKHNVDDRTLMAWVTGGIGAVIGYVGGNIVVSKSLRPLMDDVAEQTNAFIRRSAGAGAAEGIGNLAAGSAVHTVQENITRELVKQHPEKYKLANFLTNYFGGVHNKGIITVGIAAATGIAALAAYYALVPRKDAPQQGDWQERIGNEPPAAGPSRSQ